MANVAGITSVYAKYGHQIDNTQYQLLKDVTHWQDDDVQREKTYKENHKKNPITNYTLEKSFKEIFDFFDFYPYEYKLNIKRSDDVVKAWEKTIDVQQHFNDIALRIRSIAITTFTFIIGGIGYCEKEELIHKIGNIELPYSTMLAALGLVILFAFFYMDKYWYHQLLVGSVKQGKEIERRWMKILPELRLTHSIGDSSPHKFFFNKIQIHSKHKFRIFYGLLGLALLSLGIGLFVITNYC